MKRPSWRARLPRGGPLARVPRVAWACAAVALLNGLAWSLITPPFEVPDENAHYAYVQQLAERGKLPRAVAPEGFFSPAEDGTLGAIGFYLIVGRPHNPAPFSTLQQQGIENVEHLHLRTTGNGNAFTATNNPPLYYAIQTVPYKLAGAAGGSVLDRLAAMRMLSVLMAAITVLLVYLFLSELLPGSPLACCAGALVAALQPLFAFMSAGVNNDELLYLTATGVLWGIARVFKAASRPPTAHSSALPRHRADRQVHAAGVRAGRRGRRGDPTLARGCAGASPASSPAPRGRSGSAGAVVAYYAINRFVWHRTTSRRSQAGVERVGRHFSRLEELSHIWQLFLPDLGMRPSSPATSRYGRPGSLAWWGASAGSTTNSRCGWTTSRWRC